MWQACFEGTVHVFFKNQSLVTATVSLRNGGSSLSTARSGGEPGRFAQFAEDYGIAELEKLSCFYISC
jgi:hypothetical protein